MPLVRIPTAFDHPDMVWELKWDGFCAIAIVDGPDCQLLSRNGHTFRRWPDLQHAIARDVRCSRAVLDREIVCLDRGGRPNFNALLFGAGHRSSWRSTYSQSMVRTSPRSR